MPPRRMQQRSDHYRILGLPRNATPEQVKQAYRMMAKRHHPDLRQDDASVEHFHAVQAAYETLRDPLLRMAYDARLRGPGRPVRPAPAPVVRSTGHGPDLRMRSWPFLGLHVTGLLFGVTLIGGIALGVLDGGWPWSVAFFMIPGIVVIPDALHGIRLWKSGRPRRSGALDQSGRPGPIPPGASSRRDR